MREQGDAGDSAYHMEANQKVKHLDTMWVRQPVINVHIRPTRSLAFFEQGTVSLTSPSLIGPRRPEYLARWVTPGGMCNENCFPGGWRFPKPAR